MHTDHELANAPSVSWRRGRQAADLYCWPHADMQNRRIIDRAFREANSAPIPRLETDTPSSTSVRTRCSAGAGARERRPGDISWTCWAPSLTCGPCPLTDPLVEHNVGLVAVDRDPISPSGPGGVPDGRPSRSFRRLSSPASRSSPRCLHHRAWPSSSRANPESRCLASSATAASTSTPAGSASRCDDRGSLRRH